MRPTLSAHLRRQSGLVTRAQAIACGFTPREIRAFTGPRGQWVAVRRGVYCSRDLWDAAAEHTGQQRLSVLAAHLSMNLAHVVSHSSSGLIHQLPMLRVNDELVHITRPGVTGSRTEFGVKHHRAHFERDQVVDVDGVPVHDLARTAVDIGREHGYLHGLVACDASLQLGVTKTDLYKALDPMTCWPYVTRTRAAVEDSDPGAESVGETLAREFLISLGLGPVTTQFSIVVGGQLHFADLRIGRHLVEFDGRGKYRRSDRGGLADRDPEEVVWAEKTRQNLICGEGYGMSRVTWDEVWGRGRRAAAERVSREFTITTQRFGMSLPPGYQPVARRRRTA